MKNQTRQPEVWLIAYRMSEKWVTRVGGLILVSELQKTKGSMLTTVYTGTVTPSVLMQIALGAGSIGSLV